MLRSRNLLGGASVNGKKTLHGTIQSAIRQLQPSFKFRHCVKAFKTSLKDKDPRTNEDINHGSCGGPVDTPALLVNCKRTELINLLLLKIIHLTWPMMDFVRIAFTCDRVVRVRCNQRLRSVATDFAARPSFLSMQLPRNSMQGLPESRFITASTGEFFNYSRFVDVTNGHNYNEFITSDYLLPDVMDPKTILSMSVIGSTPILFAQGTAFACKDAQPAPYSRHGVRSCQTERDCQLPPELQNPTAPRSDIDCEIISFALDGWYSSTISFTVHITLHASRGQLFGYGRGLLFEALEDDWTGELYVNVLDKFCVGNLELPICSSLQSIKDMILMNVLDRLDMILDHLDHLDYLVYLDYLQKAYSFSVPSPDHLDSQNTEVPVPTTAGPNQECVRLFDTRDFEPTSSMPEDSISDSICSSSSTRSSYQDLDHLDSSSTDDSWETEDEYEDLDSPMDLKSSRDAKSKANNMTELAVALSASGRSGRYDVLKRYDH
ncbi:MAG: hypothetical protein Q9227_005523 [Pyrenula ochraceoflavens]